MNTITKLGIKIFIWGGLIAGVYTGGTAGLTRLNNDVGSLYDDQLVPVQELTNLKADLMESQMVLMTWMTSDNAAVKRVSLERLGRLNAQIEGTLERHLNSPRRTSRDKDQLAAMDRVWKDFRATRDDQVIRQARSGRQEAAMELVEGIQARRLDVMMQIADDVIDRVQTGAAGRRWKADNASQFYQTILMTVSLTAVAWVAFFIILTRRQERPRLMRLRPLTTRRQEPTAPRPRYDTPPRPAPKEPAGLFKDK